MSCYLSSICLSVSFCRLPTSEPLNCPLGQIMTSGQMFLNGQGFQDTGQILCYADTNLEKRSLCVKSSPQSAFLIIMNVRPWIFTPAALTGEWPGDVLLRASQFYQDGWRPTAWEHQFSAAFCPTISIHLSLPFHLSASDSLSLLFSVLALLSSAKSMSLCPFCHLTSQAWELERFVILYLSYSCLICQQMCSIWDFPFLCLCGPLGCQSQLRGHYWQLRRQGLSVGQSKVNFFCLGTQGEAISGDGVGLVNADFDVHFQELSNL